MIWILLRYGEAETRLPNSITILPSLEIKERTAESKEKEGKRSHTVPQQLPFGTFREVSWLSYLYQDRFLKSEIYFIK